MTNKTQIAWVQSELIKYGKISRNKCLARYISRLGAIIARIKERTNIEIEGRYMKTKKGTDYVYTLVK